MPVTGPGGPRGITPSTSTQRTEATAPTAETQAPQAPAGWNAQPGSAGTSLGDGFGGTARGNGPTALNVAAPQAAGPNPVEQAVLSNIDRFTTRLQTTLHHDALSLARGQRPLQEGDSLTAEQQDAMQSAAQDFVKGMPIGALAPELAASIQEKLKDAGVEVRDIASTKLGDLGKIGGDIAKDLLKDFKKDSPTAFYSLAAGAAAAAGYVAWTKGSEKLSQLGIKPELKQKFFDDQLQVKLKGDWQAHFKDFKATATVDGKVSLGEYGRLTGSVTANSRTGFENATVGYNLDKPNWNLSASAAFNQGGFERARLEGGYKTDTLSATAYATATASGAETVGGRFSYNPNKDFALSGGVEHNFMTDRTTANAEATWKVRENVDFALSGRADSKGDAYAGVGVRIRF